MPLMDTTLYSAYIIEPLQYNFDNGGSATLE